MGPRDPGPHLGERAPPVQRSSQAPPGTIKAATRDPPESLVGRDRDLARLLRSLTGHRAVTITGPGGVGKTALALAVAHQGLQATGAGRAVFCELADLEFPEAVRSAVAARLGVLAQPGIALGVSLPPEGDGRGLLVLLDNCEHVRDAAADVALELLAAAHVRVLATSREPLRMPGEAVLVLDPLAVPASAQALGAESAPAVVLFERRARAAGADLSLDERSLPDVVRVCRALDGLPLALEIAAARVRGLGVRETAERLGARLPLPGRGLRGTPDRHRSLRSVVEWSFDLLAPAGRALFPQLAVHAGGWDLSAAEAAGTGAGLPGEEVLEVLDELVGKSLVTVATSASGTRYGMLETLRAYGLARLEQDGALRAARDRHAQHYCALTRQIRERGLTVWDKSLLRLFLEFDNIRAALTWTLTEDLSPDRSFDLLAPLWYVGLQESADEIVALAERALLRWPEPSHPRWSEVAATEAESLLTLDDFEGARQHARAAATAAGSSPVGAAFAWCTLASVSHYADRDLTAGFGYLDRADAAAEAAGFEPLRCDLLARRAQGLAQAGRTKEAMQAAEQGLDMARQQGNPFTAANCRHLVGMLLIPTEPAAAREWLEAALAESRALTYPYGTGSSMRGLAVVCAVQGELATSAELFTEALTGFLHAGFLTERWNTVGAMLPLLVAAGRREGAATLLSGVDATGAVLSRLHTPLLDDVRTELAGELRSPRIAARGRALGTDGLLALARRELRALRTDASPAAVPPQQPQPFRAPGDGQAPEMRRVGSLWSVTFGGATVHLPDSKGIRDLAVLLAAPGTEVPALDLAAPAWAAPCPAARPSAGAGGDELSPSGNLGDRIDAQARAAYAARARDLKGELDEADTAGDAERGARVQHELDFLARELSAAYGLGRPRRAGDSAERARAAVTMRIRAAIEKVDAAHPQLAAHLRHSIRTGRFCSYQPEATLVWRVVR